MPRSQRLAGLAVSPYLVTERAGFEPAVRCDPHTAFPVPHLRPLGHLSKHLKSFPSNNLRLASFAYRPSKLVLHTFLHTVGRLAGQLSCIRPGMQESF